MVNSIADKLRIKPNSTLLTMNAPADFKKGFKALPTGVKFLSLIKNLNSKNHDQIHWFVTNQAQLNKDLKTVMKLVHPEAIVWIYYPKGTSGIQTDLTRDKGWETLMTEKNKLTWINLISFDETWSVFGFRVKTSKDKKKETQPAAREIFNWVNPVTKEIKIPADLADALKRNKAEKSFFNTLSFTNKKEYIDWIVTAKKEETRKERITGTIERLNKNWKNPRNI